MNSPEVIAFAAYIMTSFAMLERKRYVFAGWMCTNSLYFMLLHEGTFSGDPAWALFNISMAFFLLTMAYLDEVRTTALRIKVAEFKKALARWKK